MKFYLINEKGEYKEISRKVYDVIFKINAPLLCVSIEGKTPKINKINLTN